MNNLKYICSLILFIIYFSGTLQSASKPNFEHTETLNLTSINVDGPILNVSVVSSPLVSCEESTLYVHYCNDGTEVATLPYIEISLPDEATYANATIPLTTQVGNLLTFEVADININECLDFQVNVTMECDLPEDGGACFEAHIFPDDNCLVPDPNWDQSSITVSATCRNDSLIFYLENTGTGNMSENLNFFIIEEDLIVMMQDFNLNSGDIDSIALQPNANFYYMESMQSAGHPGVSIPNVTVENCSNVNGNFNFAFASQFSEDDSQAANDILCVPFNDTEVGNAKIAYPIGYTPAHFINANQQIEYQINFPNVPMTGIDQLVVCDTLAPELNPNTLVPGAASHPYTYTLENGNIAKFTFENINFEENAFGFVQFTIEQTPDLPANTVIDNDALITFGNQSWTTDSVFHTIPPLMTIENDVFVCEGDTYNGIEITQDTVFTNTVAFSIGDYTFINNVKLSTPSESFLNLEICEGEIVEVAGQTFSEFGNYEVTTFATNACDSIIYLSLNPFTIFEDITEIICAGETFTVGLETFTQTGIYFVQYQGDDGCFYETNLDLTVADQAVCCESNAGPDQQICEYSTQLQGFPEDGKWEVVCTDTTGSVIINANDSGFADVQFSTCGTYFFTYTTTSTANGNIICTEIDTVMIEMEDPSVTFFNLDFDMNLEYEPYECPQSLFLACENNSGSLGGTQPVPFWEFCTTASCSFEHFYPYYLDSSPDDCIADSIWIETETGSHSGGTNCNITDQSVFVTVIDGVVIENDFIDYINSLVGASFVGLLEHCPLAPSGCFPPPASGDGELDTLEIVVPVHDGGFWSVLVDMDTIPLMDTTYLDFNGDTIQVLATPSAMQIPLSVTVNQVFPGGFVGLPTFDFSFGLQWQEVWIMDTVQWVVQLPDTIPAESSLFCQRGNIISFSGDFIPTPPTYDCPPPTVTYEYYEIEMATEIIDCSETDYTVQITMLNGVAPYDLFGLSGTFIAPEVFLSDPIPISSPFFVNVQDANSCFGSTGGDTCPCANVDAELIGGGVLTCDVSCVTLSGNGVASIDGAIALNWYGGSGQSLGSGSSIDVCQAGTYTLEVEHLASGCTQSSSVEVEVDQEIPQPIAGEDATINCTNETIQLFGSNASPQANTVLEWSGPSIDPQTSNEAAQTIDEPGLYTLTIFNIFTGCVSSDEVVINIDTIAPTILDTETSLNCTETSTISGMVLGSADYTYWWQLPNQDTTLTTSAELETTDTGSYTLFVMNNENGCIGTGNINVAAYVYPELNITTELPCEGESNGVITVLSSSDNVPFVDFYLNDAPAQSEGIFDDLVSGEYMVNTVNVDSCLVQELINLESIPMINTDLESEYHFCGQEGIDVDVTQMIDESLISYEWSTGSESPSIFLNQSDNYAVTITTPCEIATQEFIAIDDLSYSTIVAIPRAFSPNGDSENDLFKPIKKTSIDFATYHLKIFSRWGELVFESTDFDACWDGNINNNPSPSDVYIYQFSATLIACDGEEIVVNESGDLTLLR